MGFIIIKKNQKNELLKEIAIFSYLFSSFAMRYGVNSMANERFCKGDNSIFFSQKKGLRNASLLGRLAPTWFYLTKLSARNVSLFRVPVFKPLVFWNAVKAFTVLGPSFPSTGPGLNPRSSSAF